MRRSFMALWSILAVAFIIFFVLSTCEDINVAGWHLKSSRLSAVFTETSSDSLKQDTVMENTATSNPQLHVCLDRTPKTVLIIGDSMLEGLSPRLSAYCDATGHKLYSVIWYSSSTELYGKTHLLSDYIDVLKPDYIFLSLGGNELFVSDIAEKREKYVKSIIQEIGDIPFLWIGPPNWKPDTGINDLIRTNVPEGCFFLSDGMKFDRKKDGAHPTAESASIWMDSIIRWMPQHARYYMDLDTPKVESVRPAKYFIHMPGDLTKRPK